MTNVLIHPRTYREEAAVEGSNGVSATPNEDVERSEGVNVTETMDGSEARAAILSVIRTNCFACAVSDDEEKEVEEVEEEEIQQSNLGNSSSGVSDVRSGEKEKKEEKQKDVLNLGETSKKLNWWQNILGAPSGGVSDVQKKDEKLKGVLDSGETSSNRPNSRLRTWKNRRLSNPPNHLNGELVAAGWPSWLSAVAGEAIYGWTPRRADTFEKLNMIGQGTRSTVYEARDILTGKIVALKKVQFDSLKPESVKLMAKEILMLRRLDHPNVIKLEGVMISKKSCGLYLVFQYMEHDLAGLAANREIRFTEAHVKCLMHQLLSGLKHCHHRGVLHRDINGSHLLIDDGGILKIAGFGSASLFDPKYKQVLTNRVDNLWYLSPEILLGATACGAGVDLWSTGCILAELLDGKAIMPGRIQVDQLHKIFGICGFSSDEFWEKSNLPHATVFKPYPPYRRCIAETFKHFPPSSLPLIETFLAIDPVKRGTATSALRSEFFRVQPYACDPPSLPKYPPKQKMGTSEKKNKKKIDAELQDESRLRACAGNSKFDDRKARRRDRELEEIINGESFVHHGLIDEKGFLVLRTDIIGTRDAISTWGLRIIDAS